MGERYFIAMSDEDGTRIVGPLTKEELQAKIEPGEHGDYYYGSPAFLSAIPPNSKGYWNVSGVDRKHTPMVIIKGTIIVPKPVEHVIKYEV